MKKVKAFKINVETRQIEDVKIGGLQDFYREIDNDCSLIETGLTLNFGDVIMVDEEGLLHDNNGAFAFMDYRGIVQAVLMGSGIVIGTDDEGGDKEPVITKELLQQRIVFLSPIQVEKLRQSRLDEPIRFIEL